MANAVQEANGDISMRRVLALYYAALSGALFVISSINGNMSGVYSGFGCAATSLILMGYTTISEIKALVIASRK